MIPRSSRRPAHQPIGAVSDYLPSWGDVKKFVAGGASAFTGDKGKQQIVVQPAAPPPQKKGLLETTEGKVMVGLLAFTLLKGK